MSTGEPSSRRGQLGRNGWPWSWYLRDVPSGYYDMSTSEASSSARSCSSPTRTTRRWRPRLEGYEGRKFRLRVWWVPVWGAAGPGDWLGWALPQGVGDRTPTATMDEWLYLKPEAAPARSPSR